MDIVPAPSRDAPVPQLIGEENIPEVTADETFVGNLAFTLGALAASSILVINVWVINVWMLWANNTPPWC